MWAQKKPTKPANKRKATQALPSTEAKIMKPEISIKKLNEHSEKKTCPKTLHSNKKTVNTENIPGMCVLSNHMRDLVTAENEWVLSHGIELFRKTTRFNLHQFMLQKLEVLFLSI